MPKYLLTFYFLFLISISFAVDQEEIIFNDELYILEIKENIWLYDDERSELNIDSMISLNLFEKQKQAVPNLGIGTSTHWVRMIIRNKSSSNELLLELAQPTIDNVTLYGIFDGEVFSEVKLGMGESYFNRKYDHQNFLFDLHLPKGIQQTYILKIESRNPIMLPLYLGKKERIMESLMLRDLVFGIYIGTILVMFFYNMFVFFSVKDVGYLIYVFYILIICLIQASLAGYSFRLIWPDYPWIANQSLVVLPAFGGLMAIEFLKVFTHSKEFIPRMHKWFVVPQTLFSVCILFSLSGNTILASNLIQPSAMIASLYMMIASVIMINRGSRPAQYFLTAWIIFLIGIIVFILKDLGFVGYNTFTAHILELGSAIEVVLLSIGLADRINVLRKEKEESQLKTLHALQENERMIKEQNIELERRVDERTSALTKANGNLNSALINLKEAQSQLVSAEKMASLGQLTAGIAHEINNPINFVKSNIDPLKLNIKELLELIQRYEKLALDKKKELGSALDDVELYKEEIDLDLLVDETKEIIEGIKEGATRTVEIVQGLRTFSHVDDVGIKNVDINEGINSTLTLLKGEISAHTKIELILDDLGELECYGGKINQVFMNVINNAIQAVKANPKEPGRIVITTKDLKEGVKIIIKDNGIGMDEETKEKIFDPFFTTKDVGEGTGLGLSVVYGIIDNHEGTVEVESELGKGTIFVINLPYTQSI